MKAKKRKGFTLLEILVVVVIVAVLAAVAVPQYNKIIQRADVSDALHNIDMLSGAQSKYRIKNGAYTNDLSSLDTPLKGNTAKISTGNFDYFSGNPREDNFCIYSANRVKGYTLAKNYKNGSEILCSGPHCGEIESMVKSGSLTALCGGEYNGNCDLECTSPKILREDPCSCVCDPSTCLGTGEQDPNTCQCKCLGQSVWDFAQHTCTCPDSAKEVCDSAGFGYDPSSCDCIKPEQHCENTCNAIQIQDPDTCACSCNPNQNEFTKHFCQLGETTSNCDCICPNNAFCFGESVLDPESCSCSCDKTSAYCVEHFSPNHVLNEITCTCEEKESCTDEQISACSGSNQTLNEDCSCKCTKTLFCPGQVFDKRTCTCQEAGIACAITQEECAAGGKVLNEIDCLCECPEGTEDKDCPNGHFDSNICDCACDLTDEICATYPGKRRIASTSPCECVESSCPEDVAPCFEGNGNGHYNYRTCRCECDLTDDYCKEKFGQRLNEAKCECISVVHE